MRKKVGIVKRIFTLLLIFLLSINSFAAIVSDNDGSAFITKAEFDALKSSFQSQIDSYNQSIDSKIDGAIASYLSGIKLATSEDVVFLVSNSEAVSFYDNLAFKQYKGKRSGNSGTDAKSGWSYLNDASSYNVYNYYGTENNYPWGQVLAYDWENNVDLREQTGGKNDFSPVSSFLFDEILYAAEYLNSGGAGAATKRGFLLTFDLKPKTQRWDYQNNKVYKNLVALGRKDGDLFYPSNVYPGVACKIMSIGTLLDIPPVLHAIGNNSSYWRGDQGKAIEFGPDTTYTSDAINIQGYIPVSSLGSPHTWHYQWKSNSYRLFQSVYNIKNQFDKSQDCIWEQGFGSLKLSGMMCIANKTLYISCVGGSTAPLSRAYQRAAGGGATLELIDPWWNHSNGNAQSTDYTFGNSVWDKRPYVLADVNVGGPILENWNTTWKPAISFDSETAIEVGCPTPLMNCKFKDLGSTVLRDNDGLAVKIGDGLPVCKLGKKGTLKLQFKVTSSDNQNVKLSFKYKGFQETGDYLKDDTGTLWNNKTVTSGTTYTVNFQIENINDTIYCGILNGDDTGKRHSIIKLISGTITYDA